MAEFKVRADGTEFFVGCYFGCIVNKYIFSVGTFAAISAIYISIFSPFTISCTAVLPSPTSQRAYISAFMALRAARIFVRCLVNSA